MIKKILFRITLLTALLLSLFFLVLNHQINKPLTINKAEFITIEKGTSVSSFSQHLVNN